MRVPQNIPLCRKIRYYGGEGIEFKGVPDEEVPIYTQFGAIISEEEGKVFIRFQYITASKSYKNYEPPESYIIPTGYKAVVKNLDVSNGATITSDGLGFIFILDAQIHSSGHLESTVCLIDIVKQ